MSKDYKIRSLVVGTVWVRGSRLVDRKIAMLSAEILHYRPHHEASKHRG
jgi:hypothetical protein